MYIAHKKENGEIQSLKDHLSATADLAKSNSIPEFSDIAYIIGLLHDLGKYQATFQKRINGSNIKIDHSTCGAIEAKKLFTHQAIHLAMAYCIAGHHSGLPNGGTFADTKEDGTLVGRLKKETEDYSAYSNEISLPDFKFTEFLSSLTTNVKSKKDMVEKYSFIVRYLYSCLTDADFLDTEAFMNIDAKRGLQGDFTNCLASLNEVMSNFNNTTEIQKARTELQIQAVENARHSSNISLLNMPTGSGKTLCSMKIALEKAINSGKKRIIYVIPYNSIIDQVSEVFEDIFKQEVEILRHQSTFAYDKDNVEEKTKGLACENWDAKIIITTAVQFFESIYSNRSSRLRKLHNMADSVIVFDEAHLMPQNYLSACIRGISFISSILKSEIIFLTATMPNFKKLIDKYSVNEIAVNDLIEDAGQLFKVFDKCKFEFIDNIAQESLIQKATEYKSSLIIVNSKKTAEEIYNNIHGNKYLLSTYLTMFHRQKIINDIKDDLKNNRDICVVATSLIEAGIDLDFSTVFRELNGLDNILQSAGRCNREGLLENATTFVFSLEENQGKQITIKQAICKELFKKYESINTKECINEYYEKIFDYYKDEIENCQISKFKVGKGGQDILECENPQCIPFKTYAEKFSIIESNTISVIIPIKDENIEIIEKLKKGQLSARKKLEKYAATVKLWEFENLLSQGVLEDYGTGIYILTNASYYSNETGIKFIGEDIFL